MLRTAAHTLPGAVGLLQPRGGYQKGGAQSAVIKNCLQYISTHLHEELRLEELAHECGLRSRSSTAITRTAHMNRRKEGDTMVSDGDFYRQYLNGDDAGLEALMEKYGDPLTVYLDGYLHDIHEAEELMLDVFAYLFTKKPRIRERGFRCRKAWLALLVGVPLLVFYCTYGDVLSNLIWCGLMIWLSFCAVRGLFYADTRTGKARNRRYFHIGMLCYVGSEYLLWTVGCFWSATSPASPAFWCDLLLTFALLGLLPAVRKAVEL